MYFIYLFRNTLKNKLKSLISHNNIIHKHLPKKKKMSKLSLSKTTKHDEESKSTGNIQLTITSIGSNTNLLSQKKTTQKQHNFAATCANTSRLGYPLEQKEST